MVGNITNNRTERLIIVLILGLIIGLTLFLFGCDRKEDETVKCGQYYLMDSTSAYIEIKEDGKISFHDVDLTEYIEGLNSFFDENIDVDEVTDYLAQDNDYHYNSEDKFLFLTIAEYYAVALQYDGANTLVFEGSKFILSE